MPTPRDNWQLDTRHIGRRILVYDSVPSTNDVAAVFAADADNSGLVLSDTLKINRLVCGVQIPLRATFNARPLSQLQKLDHLVVTETAEGERVQVMLTPATRPDSDVEEED